MAVSSINIGWRILLPILAFEGKSDDSPSLTNTKRNAYSSIICKYHQVIYKNHRKLFLLEIEAY